MIKMKVDNAEFGLLTAITIFSERKNLKQRKRVEKIQEIYVDALRSYVMSHRKKDPIVAFAKLLGALVELRSLGNLNSRTCFDLKLVNRRLPDFLAEIWDIKWSVVTEMWYTQFFLVATAVFFDIQYMATVMDVTWI